MVRYCSGGGCGVGSEWRCAGRERTVVKVVEVMACQNGCGGVWLVFDDSGVGGCNDGKA